MLSTRSRVIVISSVSGGGKTSLISRLIEKHGEHLHVAVTATSRSPRSNESDGIHYHFYSADEFKRKIAADELLEYAEVHGNFYGVPAAPVEAKLAGGISVILNIDYQGMRTVREKLGERVLTIFLLPPDRDVWEQRLRSRGTDSEADIQLRLQQGETEMKVANEYDYFVMNDILDRAVDEVVLILRKEGILPD